MSHGFTATNLPERILRMMSAEDRRSLGAGVMTAEEAIARGAVRFERDLQKLICAWLDLNEIVYVRSRMDKKTTNQSGLPDILVAVWDGSRNDVRLARPIAIETKLPTDRKLDDDQAKMKVRMTSGANAWSHHVVTSFEEFREIMRTIGY